MGRLQNKDALVRLFASAFTPNPFKHGEMKGYDPRSRKKLSSTVTEPVTAQRVMEHLHCLTPRGRLGYLPGREEQTDVIAIDIDHKEAGETFDQVTSEVRTALKMMGLTYYNEVSTNGGLHIWIFLQEMVPWEDAYWFAKACITEAGHGYLETFPSSVSSGAKGKWIYLPYSGAAHEDEGGRGLGVSWLTDRAEDPVPVWSLDKLVRINTSTVMGYANDCRVRLKEIIEEAEEEGELVQDLDTTAFDELRRSVMNPPKSFRRHDSIVGFLNLSTRAAQLQAMHDLLRSRDVFERWITDASRTYQGWRDEVDRWVERVRGDEGELRSRYGIKSLIEQGWTISNLQRRPEISIQTTDNLNKVPDQEMARQLSELMRQEGEHWWVDPDVVIGYRWDGLTYVAKQTWEDDIKRWIDLKLEAIGKDLREAKLTTVYKKLERGLLTRHITREQSSDLIACENGVLDWRTGELHEPHPDLLTVGRVKASWDPNADAETDWRDGEWHRYLNNVLRGRSRKERTAFIETMAEFFGYTMMPLNSRSPVRGVRKILNFHGPSSTGKSTTWRAVLAVLGDQSEDFDPSGLAMSTDQELFSSQDWAQKLVGKRVAVFDEMNTGSSHDGRRIINSLKVLAGNGAVTINPKGKRSAQARLGCRIVMCTNYELRLYEDSSNDAFFRRLLRIPFENVVPRRKEQADYEARLVEDPKIRQEIFLWMVDGLRRFAANGWSFRHDTVLADELEEAREEANPVITWLKQRAKPSKHAPELTTSELLNHYNAWAASEGLSTLSAIALGMKLPDALNHLEWSKDVKRLTRKGYRFWTGLELRDVFGEIVEGEAGQSDGVPLGLN